VNVPKLTIILITNCEIFRAVVGGKIILYYSYIVGHKFYSVL
jgi:hypothetical protein